MDEQDNCGLRHIKHLEIRLEAHFNDTQEQDIILWTIYPGSLNWGKRSTGPEQVQETFELKDEYKYWLKPWIFFFPPRQ